PVPLEILLDPARLHVLAPVADVPFSPGAEAAKLIGAEIDRHVDNRKAIMAMCDCQSSAQRNGAITPGYSHDSGNCGSEHPVVDRDAVVGAKFGLVLCDLQTGDSGHPTIIENHNHSAHAMLHGIDQNLRVHHERAIAAEGDAVTR